MKDVIIRQEEDKWIAYDGDRAVGKSGCRNCIITVMLKLTAKSTVYNSISVYNKEGELESVFRTGANKDDKDSKVTNGRHQNM